MTLEIHRADENWEYSHIATFDDGEWVEGGENVDPTDYYDGAPEELVVDDFTGPRTTVFDPEEVESPTDRQKSLSTYEKASDREYVDRVEDAPDDKVVHVDEDDELYYEP